MISLATVTQTAPLYVLVDGSTSPAPAFTLGYSPVVGHRVAVVLTGRRWVVVEGEPLPPPTVEVHSPALASPWATFATDLQLPTYYRADGRVHLAGVVTGGTTGSDVFTLPEGFRPVGRELFPVAVGNPDGFGRLDVRLDGAVRYVAGVSPANHLSLSGVSFLAA